MPYGDFWPVTGLGALEQHTGYGDCRARWSLRDDGTDWRRLACRCNASDAPSRCQLPRGPSAPS
eukprot:scaffold27867_cov120-Isochrysis_galbana.AAC.4